MRAEEIMKKDVECLLEQDTIQQASRRMRDYNIGFLPVCDAQGRAIGTLTDRDIAIRVCAEDRLPGATNVSEVMTREVVTCKLGDDLRECEKKMAEHKKSRIMVTDANDKLVGVISLSDIAEKEPGDLAAKTLREVASREARA
jgi:CBS domain-containing protein